MRIEQRIGRLDRHGQRSETIDILNLIVNGTVDADIYFRCLERIGIFHSTIGASEEILGDITKKIRTIADNLQLTEAERALRLQQLADNEINALQEQERLEAQQSELFGIRPASPDNGRISQATSAWLTPPAIANLVGVYLARLDSSLATMDLTTAATVHPSVTVRGQLLHDHDNLFTRQEARDWRQWLKGSSPRTINLQPRGRPGRPIRPPNWTFDLLVVLLPKAAARPALS